MRPRLSSYFKVFLSIVGLVVAVRLWQANHYIWAVVVGVLFGGGVGWVLLGRVVWGIYLAYGPAKMRATSKEFLRVWDERTGRIGVDKVLPPKGVYAAWREAHQRTGISAGDWLDLPETPDREPDHEIDVGNGIRALYWDTPDGVQWNYSRELDEDDPLDIEAAQLASAELRRFQIMAGLMHASDYLEQHPEGLRDDQS